METCKCIKFYEERGAVFPTDMYMGKSEETKVELGYAYVMKVTQGGRNAHIQISFCPFCGEPLKEEEDDTL